MHTIHKREFTIDDFSHEHLNNDDMKVLENIVAILNINRAIYNITNNKNDWWGIIQLLPSSYNQKRTVDLNYQVLKNMYHARKDHKLDEWRKFCRFIEGLKYAEELICITGK